MTRVVFSGGCTRPPYRQPKAADRGPFGEEIFLSSKNFN